MSLPCVRGGGPRSGGRVVKKTIPQSACADSSLYTRDLQVCEARLQASPRRGDMQAVRSTLAGFAEKRKLAFSRENNGRSLQSKPSRYHQYENFLQTPLLYVLSFLKRKYERKQFEGHIPSKTPLKVQGGTFLPRQLYPSKGGSAVRILKRF